ncbi:hypothetical protein FRC03_008780 [Tulasnella sp. 419]|nr:hypothetical protein FRC03_008780 [Tulasnella sp. 419]
MNHTGRPHYYSTQNNAVRNTSPVELEHQQSVVWEPSASSGPYQAGGMQVHNEQEQPSLHVYQAEYNVGSEDYEALTSSPPSYPDCTGQIQYPKLKTPKAPTVKQRFKCPACDSTFDRESARQQATPALSYR